MRGRANESSITNKIYEHMLVEPVHPTKIRVTAVLSSNRIKKQTLQRSGKEK